MNFSRAYTRTRIAALTAAMGVFVSTVSGAAIVRAEDVGEIKDRTEAAPKRLQGVDVLEQLGNQLKTDGEFLSSDGERTSLKQLLSRGKPTILTFNYSDCPMLCSLQLNGLVSSLKKLEWSVGKEFEVVTVILDPAEKQERSKQTKTRYLKDYERPNAASGWTFLTGKEQDVRELANSVGFQYGYNEARGEYVHPAAIALLSPEGVIARYLYGIEFHPETLRLGLVEASEGKIGSSFDRLVLFCFHYDATEGRYAPVAMNIMRLGAASVALALGIVLGIYWIAEMRKRKAQALSGAP